MKTPNQIIKDTYDNNPKLKAQLGYYGLTLDDVGLTYWNKDHTKRIRNNDTEDIHISRQHNDNAPIKLNYSMEDEKVVSSFVSLIHDKTDEVMREKRLERISKA